MTSEVVNRKLIDEALRALLRMSPAQIELAEEALRNCGWKPDVLDRKAILQLRLARAGALQAAQLWRGCIPQPGYDPAGPPAGSDAVSSLSVTG